MNISGIGSSTSTQAMTGASMRMPPAQKMSNLFSQIDTSGTGAINKDQFTQAFSSLNPPAGFKTQGADAIFAKLDANGTGSVSRQDFISGMTSLMSQIRQQRHQTEDAGQAAAAAQTSNASLSAFHQTIGSNIDVKA